MVYGRRPLGFTAPYNTSTSAFPVSVPPNPAQMTAVTFGLSIQGSMMRGPTECTTTIVLSFCAATAWTSLSPLCHAVKFFLRDVGRRVGYSKPEGDEKGLRTCRLCCHPQYWTRHQSRTARRRLQRPGAWQRSPRRPG